MKQVNFENKVQIIKIAKFVLSNLLAYQKMNPGAYAWGANREGMCAIASLMLMHHLFKIHLNPVFVTSMNHCFITIDGYLLDITATQFGDIHDDIIFEPYAEFIARISGEDKKYEQRAEPWEVVSKFYSVEEVLLLLKFKENQFSPLQWKELNYLNY